MEKIDSKLELDILYTELICLLDECKIVYDVNDIEKIGYDGGLSIKVNKDTNIYIHKSVYDGLVSWGVIGINNTKREIILRPFSGTIVLNPLIGTFNDSVFPNTRKKVISIAIKSLIDIRIQSYYGGNEE
jgi:hypothetical protein